MRLCVWGMVLCGLLAAVPALPEGVPPDAASVESDTGLLSALEQSDRSLRSLEERREAQVQCTDRLGREISEFDARLVAERTARERAQQTAKRRLRALYKFGQMGYATPLLSTVEPGCALEALSAGSRLVRADAHWLEALGSDTKAGDDNLQLLLVQKKGEIEAAQRELTRLDQEILAAKAQKAELLTRISRHQDLVSRVQAGIEENQRAIERKAFSQKPVLALRNSPFSARKGRLPLPTEGEIVQPDIPPRTSSAILYKNGLIFRAPKGQAVRAVHDGVVVFADWLKEYGKVMIVDHGEHYYSLIAHADQLQRDVGESIKAGDVIATVGSTGSLDGPKLYFEIRHFGNPVDPMEWLTAHKFSKE